MTESWWPIEQFADEVDPLAALDAHVALVRALRAEQFPFAEMNDFQPAIALALNQAVTITVTHDLLDFVLERLEHVPFGEPLQRSMLPFPAGFLVLPRPVPVPTDELDDDDPRRAVCEFDMGAWLQAGDVYTGDTPESADYVLRKNQDDTAEDEGETDIARSGDRLIHRGIGYLQICSEPLVHLSAEYLRGVGEHLGTYDIRAPLPVYSSGWRYGLSWDPAQREDSFVLTRAGAWERRFWLAMFATLNEQVDVTRPHLDRPTIRRAMRAREITDLPEIVVCNLRMIRKTAKDGTERTTRPKPQWTHRWHSKAHDRTLYRGTPQERKVPVAGCIKGPDWAPLVKKDRVYRLAR
jgi:hypothetical protein